MKIAQVCPRFYPHIGGVETHVYELSKRLVKDFEVEIITTDPTRKLPKIEEIDDIIVRRFKSFAPSNAYHISPDMYIFLKKHSYKYNIIHTHSYHALPALFASLAKDNKNKFIFTPHYHGRGHTFIRNILHKPYKILGRKIFDKSDAIICVSKFEKNLVLKDFRVNPSKVYVIPNGINFDEFRGVDQIKGRKSQSEKIILYVGRLEKYKGIEYIISALAKLGKEYVLEIVGKGSYKQNLIYLARKLGVLDRIRFYQDLNRNELIEKYAKADVLVLLSKYEAYGIVIAEALAAKTPCIVANTSALCEWIDNQNVFGIDYPIDIDSLAKLVEDVAGKKVGNVKKLISWDEVVEKLKNVYGGN